MKHFIFICGFIPLCLPGQKLPLQNTSDKTVICFTENKGQIGDQNFKPREDILFGGIADGIAFHLRNNGISYQLNRVDTWRYEEIMPEQKMIQIESSTIYRLDVSWLGCNNNGKVKKEGALDGYSNYYTETCPNGVRNVKSYETVTYKDIYNGIDLKWYQKNGRLKYDFLCAAGTNYRAIQIEITGAEEININKNGEVEIKTPFGTIIEQAPEVWQLGRTLISRWEIHSNILSFSIDGLSPHHPF